MSGPAKITFFGNYLFVNAPQNRTNRVIEVPSANLMAVNLKLVSLVTSSICGRGLYIRRKIRTQAHELDSCHVRQGPEP